MSRRARLLILLFSALLAVLAGIEIWLLTAAASPAEIMATVPDEASFLTVLRGGVLHFAFGYGPLFWLLFGIVQEVSTAAAIFMVGHIVFVALKYAAFGIIAWALTRRQPMAAAVFLAGILATPAFIFFGKVISPEYLVLLLASISVALALHDDGRLGRSYYVALSFAMLAACTKISALPLALLLPCYGFALVLRKPEVSGAWRMRKISAHIARVTLALAAIIIPHIIITPLPAIWGEIKGAMDSLPPPISAENPLYAAVFQQRVMWDQIMADGLLSGYLAASLAGLAAPALLLRAFLRKEKFGLALVLWLSASLMLAGSIMHSVAMGWYIFLPLFLYLVAFCILLPREAIWSTASLAVIALVFIGAGGPRILYALQFKQAINESLPRHAMQLSLVNKGLSTAFPCAKTGNLDAVIPSPNPAAMPAALALYLDNRTLWQAPDYLVVNHDIPGGSPLLHYVIRDKIAAYQSTLSEGALEVFVRRDLPCRKGSR